MKFKLFFCLIAFLTSLALFGQATLSVDGFARFENSLSIGGPGVFGQELEIADSDSDTDVLIDFSTATRGFVTGLNVSSANLYGTTTNDRYSFITNNVVRMILTPSGFLGIGTPGPSKKLHVREDGTEGNKTTVMLLESATSKIPMLKFDEGADRGMALQYDGTGTGNNNKMHILNTITTKFMTFTNGGNVGVGEESPSERLEVDGNLVIDAGGSANELRFYDGNTIKADLEFNGQHLSLTNNSFAGNVSVVAQVDTEIEGGGDILIDGNDNILFFTDVNTKGVVSGSGKFGINNTNPQAMFHVRAFSNTGQGLRLENDQNNNHWTWRAKNDNLEMYFNGIATGLYNGSTGQYTIVSDRRLKENITAVANGVLDGINKLKPTEYYYKSNNTKEEKSVGFIAQDVKEIFPILVEKQESGEGFYSINYSAISVLNLKALQEQQLELNKIEKEIKEKLLIKEKIKSYRILAEQLKEELVEIENREVKEKVIIYKKKKND